MPDTELREATPQELADKAKAEDLDSKERKALELRRNGLSYEQIADRLGYSGRSGAYHLVERALAKVQVPEAKLYLKLEMERLENLYAIAFQALAQSVRDSGGADPHLGAMDRCLRIIQQKLAVINPDQKNTNIVMGDIVQTTNNNVVTVDGDKESYLAKLQAMAEALEPSEYQTKQTHHEDITDAVVVEEEEGGEERRVKKPQGDNAE